MLIEEHRHYEKVDFTQAGLPVGEYFGCRFSGCDFTGADFAEASFSDCLFSGCNLSLVRLGRASFTGVRFVSCKLLGLHFESLNPFGLKLDFRDCLLDHASFYGLKLKKTRFVACRLIEVDFSEADLSGARFDRSLLDKADFRAAVGYVIDLTRNRAKKARFDLAGLPGLLQQYDLRIEAD